MKAPNSQSQLNYCVLELAAAISPTKYCLALTTDQGLSVESLALNNRARLCVGAFCVLREPPSIVAEYPAMTLPTGLNE